MHVTDQDLLARWIERRDAEAFREIASRHSALVYATCKRILGNATEAEDVAQECFEVLARKGTKTGMHVGAWLHRVATNRSLKRLRAERRRKSREMRFASEKDSSVQTQWDDIYPYVDEAVAQLPEKLRAPIILHFFEQQTHQAIAEAVGTSRTNVTYRIKKGVEEIGKSLRKRGIPVAGSALTALMSANLAEAAPAALTVALGKLAFAAAGWKAVGGVLVLKKAGIVIAGMLALTVVWWGQTQRRQPTTAEPPALVAPVTLDADGSAPDQSPVRREAVPAEAEADIAGKRSDSQSTLRVPPFVAGTVLDGEGKAVPGARVEARLEKERYKRFEPTPRIAAQTATASDGTFVLGRLPPDEKLLLVVIHPDWAISTGLLNPLGENEARERIECRLKAGLSPHGRVVTAFGQPVPGADVSVSGLYPQDYFDTSGEYSPYYKHLDFGVLCSVKSDRDGRFILPRLDPECAIWGLSARAPGFARNFAWSEKLSEAEAETYSERVRINWRASFLRVDGEEIVVTLLGGGGFEGQVVDARTDRPLSGAFVYVEGYVDPPRGSIPEIIWENACTNDDGTYRLCDLPERAYKALAVHGDLMSDAKGVNVRTGEVSDNINFELAPAASLSGLVYDSASGEPLARVPVAMMDSALGGMARSATTDLYGRYRFDRVHPGAWRIMPESGWTVDWNHYGMPESMGLDIEVAAQEARELDLYVCRRVPERSRAGRVRVRVVDRYGRATSRAEVILDLERGGQRGGTDADGEFLFKRVKPGTHTVSVRDLAAGLLGWEAIDVVAGEETFTQIVPHMPGGVVDGHVLNPDGNPVEGLLTVTFSRPGLGNLSAAVDESGAYTSGPLPAGHITVRVRDPERKHIWEPIEHVLEIAANEPITGVDFVVRPMTERVAGVVRYPDGKPAVGKTLELHGWGLQKYDHTDGHGRFRFEGVAGDDLTLEIGDPPSGGGFGSSEWLFIRGIKAGQEDLELILYPTGSVTGHVLLTERELERQPTDGSVDAPLLQVRIRGENGFFQWLRLHEPAFELRLQPGFYDLEFFIEPRISGAGHMLVEQVEVASGKVTDLGSIELIRGEAEELRTRADF